MEPKNECRYCIMAGIYPPRPSIGKTLSGLHICKECSDFYGLEVQEPIKKDEKKDEKPCNQ